MKIIQRAEKPAPKNPRFENGHIYRIANGDKHRLFYLCACDYLIDMCTGNAMHSITAGQRNPEWYEDVTDQFSLVENVLLEKTP